MKKGFNFELDTASEWRWSLKDGNYKTVADSAEGYKHKADCEEGAKRFTSLGVDAPEREVAKPSSTNSGSGAEYEYFPGENDPEQWYWHFQANNNKIIADGSEGYDSKSNVKRAITNVRSLLKEIGGGGGITLPTTGGGLGGGVNVPPVRPTPGPSNPPKPPGDRPVG